jgi:hypothetical protein
MVKPSLAIARDPRPYWQLAGMIDKSDTFPIFMKKRRGPSPDVSIEIFIS